MARFDDVAILAIYYNSFDDMTESLTFKYPPPADVVWLAFSRHSLSSAMWRAHMVPDASCRSADGRLGHPAACS